MTTTTRITTRATPVEPFYKGDVVFVKSNPLTVFLVTKDSEGFEFAGVCITGSGNIYDLGEYVPRLNVPGFERFYGEVAIQSEQ